MAVTWDEFARAAPAFAAAGEKLFRRFGVVLLATVGADGSPHVAPVSPILTRGGLFLSVNDETPKHRDLARTARYALHTFLGDSDEEFQVSGPAVLIHAAAERERVQAAIEFQFEAHHPIYRLDIDRCLHAWWEKAGQPGTYPIKRRWAAP